MRMRISRREQSIVAEIHHCQALAGLLEPLGCFGRQVWRVNLDERAHPN
jgi:hypothetical protein